MAGEILKNKNKASPSPGQYDTNKRNKYDRILGNYKRYALLLYNFKISTSGRNGFTDEAIALSMEIPSSKYQTVDMVNFLIKIKDHIDRTDIWKDHR